MYTHTHTLTQTHSPAFIHTNTHSYTLTHTNTHTYPSNSGVSNSNWSKGHFTKKMLRGPQFNEKKAYAGHKLLEKL